MKERYGLNRLLALLMAAVMLVSLAPRSAFAAEIGDAAADSAAESEAPPSTDGGTDPFEIDPAAADPADLPEQEQPPQAASPAEDGNPAPTLRYDPTATQVTKIDGKDWLTGIISLEIEAGYAFQVFDHDAYSPWVSSYSLSEFEGDQLRYRTARYSDGEYIYVSEDTVMELAVDNLAPSLEMENADAHREEWFALRSDSKEKFLSEIQDKGAGAAKISVTANGKTTDYTLDKDRREILFKELADGEYDIDRIVVADKCGNEQVFDKNAEKDPLKIHVRKDTVRPARPVIRIEEDNTAEIAALRTIFFSQSADTLRVSVTAEDETSGVGRIFLRSSDGSVNEELEAKKTEGTENTYEATYVVTGDLRDSLFATAEDRAGNVSDRASTRSIIVLDNTPAGVTVEIENGKSLAGRHDGYQEIPGLEYTDFNTAQVFGRDGANIILTINDDLFSFSRWDTFKDSLHLELRRLDQEEAPRIFGADIFENIGGDDWRCEIAVAEQGVYELHFSFADVGGNQSSYNGQKLEEYVTPKLVVDTEPPEAAIQNRESYSDWLNAADGKDILLDVSDSLGVYRVAAQWNGNSKYWNWGNTKEDLAIRWSRLPEGVYDLTLTVEDLFGNITEDVVTVRKDTTRPAQPEITWSPKEESNFRRIINTIFFRKPQAEFTVTVRSSDAVDGIETSGVAQFELRSNAEFSGSVFDEAQQNYVRTMDAADNAASLTLTDAFWGDFTATAIDAAGNRSTDQRTPETYVLDNTPADVTIEIDGGYPLAECTDSYQTLRGLDEEDYESAMIFGEEGARIEVTIRDQFFRYSRWNTSSEDFELEVRRLDADQEPLRYSITQFIRNSEDEGSLSVPITREGVYEVVIRFSDLSNNRSRYNNDAADEYVTPKLVVDKAVPRVQITNKSDFRQWLNDAVKAEGVRFTASDSLAVRKITAQWNGSRKTWTKENVQEELLVAWDELPEGEYDLTVTAADLYGNEVSDTVAVKKDNTAPEKPEITYAPASGFGIREILNTIFFIQAEKKFTLTARSSDAHSGVQSIELHAPDEFDGSSFSAEHGDYMLTLDAVDDMVQLEVRKEFQGKFTAVAIDAVGNRSDEAETEKTFVLDNTPANVTVEISGGSPLAEYADGFQKIPALADEDYETARIFDENGTKISITIEDGSTEITRDGLIYALDHALSLELRKLDEPAGIQSFDGSRFTSEDGLHWSCEIPIEEEGVYEAAIRFTDAGDNRSVYNNEALAEYVTPKLVVDTAAPLARETENDIVPEAWVGGSYSGEGIRFGLTDTMAVYRVEVYDADGRQYNWSGETDGILVPWEEIPQGKTTVSVKAWDYAGHTLEQAFTVWKDTQAPSIARIRFEEDESLLEKIGKYFFFRNQNHTDGKARFKVIVTAVDESSGEEPSGVERIDLIPADASAEYTLSEFKQEDAQYTATFVVAGNYRGEFSAEAIDTAGNRSGETQPDTETVVVLDNTPAGVSVTLSQPARILQAEGYQPIDGLTASEYATSYAYQDQAEIFVEFNESNFDLSKLDPFRNDFVMQLRKYTGADGSYSVVQSAAAKDVQEPGHSFRIAEEGVYALYIHYTDVGNNWSRYGDGQDTPVSMDYITPKLIVDRDDPVAIITNREEFETSVGNSKWVNAHYTGKGVRFAVTDSLALSKVSAAWDGKVSDWDAAGRAKELLIPWSQLPEGKCDVVITAMDYAGRSKEAKIAVWKDTVAPSVRVSYSEANIMNRLFGTLFFYQTSATVYFTVTDASSGANALEYVYPVNPGASGVNTGGSGVIRQWSADRGNYTGSFVIPAQFLGHVDVVAFSDIAGNDGNAVTYPTYQGQRVNLVVDSIAPRGTVTISDTNHVDDRYYDGDVTAEVTVNEANFYPENYTVLVDGEARPVRWTGAGDVHTAAVTVEEEGDHVITLQGKDYSNNQMATVSSDEFTLDKTAPEATLSGLTNRSANDTEDMQMDIVISDTNLDSDSIAARLIAYTREPEGEDGGYRIVRTEIDLSSNYMEAQEDGSYIIHFDKFEQDGYYQLAIEYADLAGHKVDYVLCDGKEIRDFAVTRNVGGSVFTVKAYLNGDENDELDINGGITNCEDITVCIEEYNTNKVNYDEDHATHLTINNGSEVIPVELTSENYVAEDGGFSTDAVARGTQDEKDVWNVYSYTLDKSYFASDGMYDINLITFDETPVRKKNTNTAADGDHNTHLIDFVVDRTPPVIYVNLSDGYSERAESFTTEITIDDSNLSGSDPVVYLNKGRSKETPEISRASEDSSHYLFQLSGRNDEITVDYTDLAGNPAQTKVIRDVTVSTDALLLWYSNKPLLYGTVGGFGVAAGALSLLLGRRSRKKKKAASKV